MTTNAPVKAYKNILPNEKPDDQAYIGIFDTVAQYTMTSRDGLETTYSLFQAVEYIVENKIPRDMVECGVWRGGSMMLFALALKHFGDVGRKLFLYNIFRRHDQPDDIDIDFDNKAMKPVGPWPKVKPW